MREDPAAASPTPDRWNRADLMMTPYQHLDPQLLARQIIIESALGHEFIVRSDFRDTSFFEDHDGVSFANRAQAMRDYNCGATGHQTPEIFLDGAFRFGIERACGFVKN